MVYIISSGQEAVPIGSRRMRSLLALRRVLGNPVKITSSAVDSDKGKLFVIEKIDQISAAIAP